VRPIDLQERGQRDVSPLELGLVELPTRPRSEYTAKVRREALEAADQGMLRAAADLTRAAMTEDGYARGVLGSLVYGLWGLPMNFIGKPDMIAALTDTPEGAGQWRIMFPQPDAVRLMSWGITLGVGIGQMRRLWSEPGEDVVSIQEAENGTYKIRRRPDRPIGEHVTRVLRTWDPKYLRYQWWDDSWWLMTADGEIRITPNDGEWILYMPYGSIKPWEYGAWKALTLAFVLGRDGLFDRSRHAEILAPVRVGKVPQGTTEKQRRLYLQQIREMQRMQSFVLPPGLEYEIVESTHKIGDIYDKIIEWSRSDYTVTLTGNETTTTGSKGFSSGDVQERIARHVLKSFSTSLADCLHDGGLIEWGLENYDNIDVPRPMFDCDPPEDKKVKADTLKAAGEGLSAFTKGLAEAGGKRPTKESIEAFAQAYGFEVEDIPDAAPAIGEPTDDAGDQPSVPQAIDAGPPTDESAAALAAKMTEHNVERCGHGALNKCRLCGVERDRDFTPGRRGQPVMWHVRWRPIRPVNGAVPLPLLSPGGDA
jgi:hypothetical protein